LNKTPIVINAGVNEVLPEKVKTLYYEDMYTIRKDIGPDLKLDKIIDEGVKTVLKNRLEEYGNDPKKAFVDLEKNPIWLNKEKGISIKRVTISGVSTVERIGIKRDHFGKALLDSQGNNIPAAFVSTGNNHHVAIYEDDKGGLHERVVSMFEAVQLKNAGLEVIDKSYNSTIGWKFKFSMMINEYFVIGNKTSEFDADEFDFLDSRNRKLISSHLFRVQKLSEKNYMFRHHLETSVNEVKQLRDIAYVNLRSLEPLRNFVKVRLNHIGEIISVGEY
jgi:CRISPR-associated endonuclease Csn1